MKTTRSSAILLAGLAFACTAGRAFAADATVPATQSVAPEPAAAKPWRKDNDCLWWLSGADGKSLRASIEQDADGVGLTIADPAFKTWSEVDRIKVELRFDHDAKRRVTTKGWVTRGEGYAMFGLNLSADALGKLGGATTLELRRNGKVVVEQQLSATPTKAELLACVPVPSTGPSDSE